MKYLARRLIALVSLLLLPTRMAKAGEVVVERLRVESATCYRLDFKAQDVNDQANWLLRAVDERDEVPHEGCYEAEWQKIVPDLSVYTCISHSA